MEHEEHSEKADYPDWTAGAVAEFCDFLAEKKYVSPETSSSWRTAVTRVLEKVEGDGWEQMNLKDIDTDRLFARFEVAGKSDFTGNTIRAYRKRFLKALEEYGNWAQSPSTYSPDIQRRRKKSRDASDKKVNRRMRSEPQPSAVSEGAAQMLRYPFPVRSGVVAEFVLPTDLKHEEAERMARFLQSLAVHEVKDLPPGRDHEAA